ncbi:MAG: 3-deoxy-D-manno-octulosonic acid transferase [Roseibium sp.]
MRQHTKPTNWSAGLMAERRPALITLYRALARALAPVFHLIFGYRSRAGKEIVARKGERFGRPSVSRPLGKLVWIHAASVGETTSVLPLIEKLFSTGHRVLLTTVTVTSSEIAEKRLPDGCIHQFAPFDSPGYVARFLEHWKPDLAMVVESEIWPCMFDEVRTHKIPFVMLNGRLSAASARNWSRLRGTSSYIFGCLDLVLAQSPADAERLRTLGCQRVETPGNLKFDATLPEADLFDVGELVSQIGDRPVWLAALTHSEEDDLVLTTHDMLSKAFPGLLLILVPRHPARASEVAERLKSQGLRAVRRSQETTISSTIDVYLGDTLGEMGLYYRLAPVTFLGGSFNDAGGHSPVEASLLGSALVTGPRVANARTVYNELWAQNAARRVDDPDRLAGAVSDLLRNPEDANAQAERARDIVKAGRGAVDKTLSLIEPYLGGAGTGRPPETSSEQSA